MEFLLLSRNFLENRSRALLEVTSSTILSSLLLGSDLKLAPELLSQIKTTGTLYFFVISGLHFTILEQMIGSFLRPLPVSKTIQKSTTFLFLLCFGGVVGFSIPIMRTLVMHTYSLLGTYSKRKLSKKIIFIWMVVVASGIAPFQATPTVLSISFLLSFGAVLALLFFTGKQRGRTFFDHIKNQFWAGVSVNLCIAPLLLYFFTAWNPLSIFFSVLFSPFITVLVVLGFVFLAWESVSVGLFSSFTPVSTLIVGSFSLLVRVFSVVLEYCDEVSWNLTQEISLLILGMYYLFLCGALLVWLKLRKHYETDFL